MTFWLSQHKDAFAAAASLVSILGVISIIVALWSFIGQQRETKRSRAFERTKLSLELMSRYYDDHEFDDLRHRLWAGKRSQPNLLSRGEIRLLNYFEALALAVDQGVLDVHLVRRMLGAPLRQLAENPFLDPMSIIQSTAIRESESYGVGPEFLSNDCNIWPSSPR